MNISKLLLIYTPLAFLTVLFSGCAVTKNGNGYVVGIDQSEITAKVIENFKIGNSPAVLRKTINGHYEVKLYDRMKIIDLGQFNQADIVASAHFETADLLIVHVQTNSCPYNYRAYQIDGYDVHMWDLNPIYSDCQVPLSSQILPNGWLGVQESDSPNRKYWAWQNGRMYNDHYSALMASTNQNTNNQHTQNASQRSRYNMSNAGNNVGGVPNEQARFKGHFESGAAYHSDYSAREKTANTSERHQEASARKGEREPISSTKPTLASSAPRRINAGQFEELSIDSRSEIHPIKVNLRDSTN